MDLIIADTPSQLGEDAAALIADHVRRQPDSVLGLATGSSPLPVYEHLARHCSADFSGVTCFALDEYVGLDAEHPQSYRRFLADRVAGPLGIDPARVHVPAGDAEDLDAACAAFEDSIAEAGGVDLQILGIGRNGHLAFNEPGSAFSSRTRPVRLAEDTRRANARFFDAFDQVPDRALTQGIATIMEARHLLLVAQGAGKATALALALEGPRHRGLPRLHHPAPPQRHGDRRPGGGGPAQHRRGHRGVTGSRPSSIPDTDGHAGPGLEVNRGRLPPARMTETVP